MSDLELLHNLEEIINEDNELVISEESAEIISDILSGGKMMLIGKLIKNQFLTARNWPFGSAISVFLLCITLVIITIYRKTGGKMEDLG